MIVLHGLGPLAYSCVQGRPGPRHVDAPGSLIIRRSLKPALLKLFRPKTGLANLFFFGGGELLKISHNFWRNSFPCGNLSSLAPYFPIIPVTS